MKIKVKILWVDNGIGYARNSEYGDFPLTKDEVGSHKPGDIIEIESDE
jgi:hypothetical protein